MKKLGTIVAVLALVLCFSQCKKENTPINNCGGVRITLSANYGRGGEKSGFVPGEGSGNGSFVWTDGATEYIYVGGSEHTDCLGVLSGTGNGTGSMSFEGDLTTTPSENETLYFFYLGKGQAGTAVTSLDFSKQDGTLANVTNYHVAISDGVAYTGQSSFSTTLNMAMAIAYFDVSRFKNSSNEAETVYLHGEDIYTTATIDYQNGTIAGSKKGFIDMGVATSGKYVALLPSVTTETTLKFDSNSKMGDMKFLRGIQAAKYYAHSGEALSVTANDVVEGTLSGLFSISDKEKVRFSKGNLQFIGSATPQYWKFADTQWEYLGDNGQISEAANVDRDLFGWGTSGYYHGAYCYDPWSTSGTNTLYFVYGNKYLSLFDGNGTADWGYNRISNGGNAENSGWRTLTKDEWDCVISTRDEEKRYLASTSITVNNTLITGLILFPDGYTGAGVSIGYAYNTSYNTVSEEDWRVMEASGAVFLPAAGYRNGATSLMYNGSDGYYWSSSVDNDSRANRARTRGYIDTSGRSDGLSVRLVYPR